MATPSRPEDDPTWAGHKEDEARRSRKHSRTIEKPSRRSHFCRSSQRFVGFSAQVLAPPKSQLSPEAFSGTFDGFRMAVAQEKGVFEHVSGGLKPLIKRFQPWTAPKDTRKVLST